MGWRHLALNRQVGVIMIDTSEFTKPLRGEIRSGIVRRRRWRAEENSRIVAEAVAPGSIIPEVARRHGFGTMIDRALCVPVLYVYEGISGMWG